MFLFEPVKLNCATGCVADAVVPVNFIDNCIAWMRQVRFGWAACAGNAQRVFCRKKINLLGIRCHPFYRHTSFYTDHTCPIFFCLPFRPKITAVHNRFYS